MMIVRSQAALSGAGGPRPRTRRSTAIRAASCSGPDAIPYGFETLQQIFGDRLYEIYFRFFETENEYFDYAPAPVPPQGRWSIYGLGLPESILRKVCNANRRAIAGARV